MAETVDVAVARSPCLGGSAGAAAGDWYLSRTPAEVGTGREVAEIVAAAAATMGSGMTASPAVGGLGSSSTR